jgi:hypothetical protein
MTRPSFSVRIAGKPLVCLALVIGCALVAWGWLEGNVSWWVGVIACGVALRTLEANQQLRRYNTWLAAWNAMAEEDDATRRRQPARASSAKNPGRVVLLVAASLVIGIPAIAPHSLPHEEAAAFAWIWVGACAVVLWRVIAVVRRHRRKGAKPDQAGAAVDCAVAWLLPRASSSPSWQAARQQVPDYCRSLLNAVGQRSEGVGEK